MITQGSSAVGNGLNADMTTPPYNVDVVDLAERMHKELDIKTRRRRLKLHMGTFKGSEAVDWLARNSTSSDREAALSLASEMHRRGIIQGVKHKQSFSDKPGKLYRFGSGFSSSDDNWSAERATSAGATPPDANALIDQLESHWSKQNVVRSESPRESKQILREQITQLEAQVAALAAELKNQAEMSGILLDSLTGEIRTLELYLKTVTDQKHQDVPQTPAVPWSVILALPLASSLVTALLIQAHWNYGFWWLLATSSCSLAAALWLYLPRWAKQAEGMPEVAGRLVHPPDTPWAPADSGNCARHSHGEMTTAELLYRLRSLPRRSTSISSLSGSDDEVFISARSTGVADMPDSRNGDSSNVNVAFTRENSVGNGAEQHSTEARSPQACSSPKKRSPRLLSGASLANHSSSGAQPDLPCLENFKDWPDSPILIRPAKLQNFSCLNLVDGNVPINTGRKLEFESGLFKGCAVIWVKGLSSAPASLFAGKQRRTTLTIQGRFKKDVSLDDLCTGQEFFRPAKNLPAQWVVESVLIKIAKSISPSMSIGPMSKPHVLVPIITGAQLINVASPGQEPDCTQTEIPEDMSLFDPQLVDLEGMPVSSARRQKHFRSPNNRNRMFSREHVWTFCIYQSQVDMSAYELNVGLRFDLCRHLDGQPLQFMVKDRKHGEYLCSFQAWHKKLLADAQKAVQAIPVVPEPKSPSDLPSNSITTEE